MTCASVQVQHDLMISLWQFVPFNSDLPRQASIHSQTKQLFITLDGVRDERTLFTLFFFVFLALMKICTFFWLVAEGVVSWMQIIGESDADTETWLQVSTYIYVCVSASLYCSLCTCFALQSLFISQLQNSENTPSLINLLFLPGVFYHPPRAP